MLPMLFTIGILAATGAMLAHMFWLGQQTLPAGTGIVPETPEAARQHLVWGAFYVNPDDPRGWLPKPIGLGSTVNFRTVRQVALFVGLGLLDLLLSIGLVVAVLTLP